MPIVCTPITALRIPKNPAELSTNKYGGGSRTTAVGTYSRHVRVHCLPNSRNLLFSPSFCAPREIRLEKILADTQSRPNAESVTLFRPYFRRLALTRYR
jgi:hypothetical protein